MQTSTLPSHSHTYYSSLRTPICLDCTAARQHTRHFVQQSCTGSSCRVVSKPVGPPSYSLGECILSSIRKPPRQGTDIPLSATSPYMSLITYPPLERG